MPVACILRRSPWKSSVANLTIHARPRQITFAR
jgi:hypothetical protein